LTSSNVTEKDSKKVVYNPVLLYELIKQGDLESIKKMIIDNREKINDVINHEGFNDLLLPEENALFAALRYCFIPIVHFLLKEGADPNVKCSGTTPLVYICEHYPLFDISQDMGDLIQADVVRLLIKFRADVNSKVECPYHFYHDDLFLSKMTYRSATKTPLSVTLEKPEMNLDVLNMLLETDVDLTIPVRTYYRDYSRSGLVPRIVNTQQPPLYIAFIAHPGNKNLHEILLSKIRDQVRRTVLFDANQERYRVNLKNYIQRFSVTLESIPESKKIMELLMSEVYGPLMQEYLQKSTFILGLSPKIGSDSAIGSESFARNPIIERQVIKIIFQFTTASNKVEVPKKGPICFKFKSVKPTMESDPPDPYTIDPVTGILKPPRIMLKPLPPEGCAIFSQNILSMT
jgi:hypothetical protein